jgi:hypothetical protein
MKTDFDRIIGSGPANTTAAKVTARGEHWEPATSMPHDLQHWKAPPPMQPFVSNPAWPDVVNMAGKKFGRFTVIGVLADDGGKNRGCRWVCRCVCGDYEVRSTKAIRLMLTAPKKETGGARCWYCSRWDIARERYKEHGSRPVSDFTKPQEKKVASKRPEEIIAARLPAVGTTPHMRLAMMIVSDLQKAGYRIVRQQHQEPTG